MTAMKTNHLFYSLWLLFAAALYFFENNTGTRAVLAASVLVPLFSILCAYGCSRKAALTLDLPAYGEKGVPLACRLSASPLIFCEVHATLNLRNALTQEETRAEVSSDWPVSFPVPHCGLMTVSVERAEFRDVFGLCRFVIPCPVSRQALVTADCFSAQVATDFSPSHTREDSRFSAVRIGDDFSETQSIRPYLPGDPVRQIHWKLSAKMGQTLLREIGAPQTGGLLLALAVDFASAPSPDALEASLVGLLSASQSLVEQGIAHHVSLWRRAPMAVASRSDWEAAQAALLTRTSPDQPEDGSFERVAVFAPQSDVQAADAQARVTLVLPEDAQALVGDIPVVFFGPHSPFLTL